ncbi:unnamed protein product [Cuscuta epithymum]|uniref:Uncharacterized protein n=1 Tax=Cuscuta epithymum TaxID=186058 RepID=A0AAV0FQT0_9ASTE|nr:unnamed protein product [Cuscuta epithymum]CAH9137481.1 unnamed protein product [Cuscuta epithymum]
MGVSSFPHNPITCLKTLNLEVVINFSFFAFRIIILPSFQILMYLLILKLESKDFSMMLKD